MKKRKPYISHSICGQLHKVIQTTIYLPVLKKIYKLLFCGIFDKVAAGGMFVAF